MKEEIYKQSCEAVRLLKEKNMTVSTAESCTGGLAAAYITAVSGSSAVFELGMTSYSCRVKRDILGVNGETLEEKGAVSPETAREMAENIRDKARSDIGLSVTGVAGPDSSEGHAPGLVYIAAAYDGGTAVKELNINPLSRNYVRETAVSELFKLAIDIIGR
ncbi:MAG: CinA family protein [Acutalibacteraceae bacterium]